MSEETARRHGITPRKKPNFPLVVAVSGLALLIIFAAAWLFVRSSGKHLLPPVNHRPHGHASLRLPGAGTAQA